MCDVCTYYCQNRRLCHLACLRAGLDLKAQTMEMACEDECNSAYEPLRKAEMRKLSVLAIFQMILMIILCCMTSTANHCSWLSVFHSCICNNSDKSACFFEVGQEFSKSRGNSWRHILSKMYCKYLVYCPWGNYFRLEK